jgi:hypothetical protein
MAGLLTIVRLIPLVIAAVNSVERLVTTKRGKDKQDAAVDMVRDLLPLVEGVIGKDVFDDPSMQDAVRKLIDAAVAVENQAKLIRARQVDAQVIVLHTQPVATPQPF